MRTKKGGGEKRRKNEKKNFTLLVECKMFFESEFIGFKVYSIFFFLLAKHFVKRKTY